MAVACVYCGGSHDSPAGVRECWQSRQGREHAGTATQPSFDGPMSDAIDVGDSADVVYGVDAAPPDAPPRPASGAAPSVFGAPGPDALARNLVVASPDAVVPAPWTNAERVVVDDAVLAGPEPVVARLTALAAAGTRTVIELAVPFPGPLDPPRSTTTDAPYRLGARFWFPHDVLHHVVWANAIDHTGPRPSWWAV
ncbi:MAG TPA: hypothetical protein PLV68_12795, partial [Ilumatobacteraceae bacterium]|nr:hypothetical protein [Ilumatobacteraceae bacterium]